MHQGLVVQVLVYVDGTLMGEVKAGNETPHHIVHRLCEVDLRIVGDLEQPPPQQGVGFKLKLPALPEGRHEVRPVLKKIDRASAHVDALRHALGF